MSTTAAGAPQPFGYVSYHSPQALNRYSYVLNNPLRYSDPSGHCPQPSGQYANANIICVAGFIATETSTGIPFLVFFQGDGRDFSSASDKHGSRFWLWLNANTGEIIERYVHPTQRVSGPNGEPIGDPSPPRNQPHDNELLERLLGSNQFATTRSDDGSITLSYHVVCSDPICNNGLAPDGVITFRPDGRGSFAASGKVNQFPNLEAYHWNDGTLQGDFIIRFQHFSAEELAREHAKWTTSFGMVTYRQFDTQPGDSSGQQGLFYALTVR
ncbi:MAG: hypothetical protein WAZ19_09460 [Anaerolineae bacterium]